MVSSSSSKRIRTFNGTQNVSCLVDGCTSDLSNCREYHRRHRVCERHSKTPVVVVGGEEQRFCQQCSRFHSLGEFDEVKRSCRKRLDGHNRRRRKLQPESLYMSSQSVLFDHQGTRFLQFRSPQFHATSAVDSPTLVRLARSEEEAVLCNHLEQWPIIHLQDYSLNSFNCINNGGDTCQPLLNGIASSRSGRASHNMPSEGLSLSINSECALSLLSLHPTRAPGLNLSHWVQLSESSSAQHQGWGLNVPDATQDL